MMTPELNARIVEVEMTNRHRPQAHHRPTSTTERSDTMSFYAKYLRYALSTLASVAFGAHMPN